jgi:phosphohistidine phosphatase
MKDLILLRHAKAVAADGAPDDRARALTERGRRDAKAAGDALREARAAADAVLVSSAARTRETAAVALQGLGLPEPTFLDDLYLAEPETIWAAAQAAGAARVLVVGHNPGLHDLAAHLVRQSGDRSRLARAVEEGFPTSAFAIFALDGDVLAAAAPRFITAWGVGK